MKINYILLFFILCAMLTASCESAKDKKQNTAVNERDTSKIVPFDGPDDTPSQTEERAALIKRYDEVQIIDTTFIDGTDSLHFYLKYYCLKNDKIKVPKKYQSDEKVPYLFVTHPFASDITLIRNADTVLKKQFTANDFKPFYNDPFVGALKKIWIDLNA
ncbi:hypothetical protein HQ865_06995 [Mucilaginibacter mali]|uniref:Lipoprotein n=1 Tax=Mucilaginibacter mali TaxID=2740462 RepID=A0A7D4Q6T0_9SPHI|nr:hypothetical protein [Mucilaginibacter mali]QKJ29511.1 hypothetical protein HQ865_06995 [Mucilaginibacter mali]